ncbi:MAG: RidA family protein [candidate division WOR-3 bacterium]
MVQAERKLKQLGFTLPTPPAPVANYVRAVRTGDLVFLSGAGPVTEGGVWIKGKLGADLKVEDGYKAAQLCALNLLSGLKAEIGNLDNVTRIVKVLGMVNSDPTFGDQPRVINGCSDLLVNVFGEKGRHARSAVGMGALPMGIAVEIEMVVEVKE